MKYFIALLLLTSFPFLAYAQQAKTPPEVRPFTGITYPDKKKAELEAAQKRQPNVEIWLPPKFQASEEKWPLLIFSHGFGGCAKQSKFLMEYLSDHGYVVVAPDHADANCRARLGGGRFLEMRSGSSAGRPEKPFRNPDEWTDKTEADRRDDVLFALSSLLDDRMYKNYVDTDRMGLIGHSLGGYTVLGMAGAWPSWTDRRFKAVLAFSPYTDPYLRRRALGNIHVPVMYQGGTRDTPITPDLRRTGGAYTLTPAPKYYVEFDGADHFAWTELERDYQPLINESALSFFDRYVKGASGEIVPAQAGGKVSTVWKDEGVKAP